MITDAQLDHIIELFDGVPFLKDQEISRAPMELRQWRKLGRELDAHSYVFPIDLDMLKLKLRRLLASIEGKE